MLEIQLLEKKKKKNINTNFKMKIQNLEHLEENHTSIFNNNVNNNANPN